MTKNQDIVGETKPIVLIVDDNSKNLQVLGNILKVKNWKIGVAVNGRLALQMAENINPDLILLDIMMPDLNGYQVCKKIKASPATKDIPIIFLTAKTETDDFVRGFRLGACDYITKPFNSFELLARVTTQIELRKARKAKSKLEIERIEALAQMRELSSLLPICKNCLQKRDEAKYWQRVEDYIKKHQRTLGSSCICAECKAGG